VLPEAEVQQLQGRTSELQVMLKERAIMAGTAAAAVVTCFTFLPSFVFILAGGPVIESTHGKLQFTAPLRRHHGRGGRRHPQPGHVLCVPRVLAAGFWWPLRCGVSAHRFGSGNCAV
jgi:hypothetical protein